MTQRERKYFRRRKVQRSPIHYIAIESPELRFDSVDVWRIYWALTPPQVHYDYGYTKLTN